MKLIAHRGNTNGPNTEKENNPKYIDECINAGYDVEVDVRYDTLTEVFWLGHNEPQYKVSWKWMANRSKHLWIHCKDIISLYEFTKYDHKGYEYFWHNQDDFTLTSNGYIWTYPGKPYTPKSIIVMPEWNTKVNSLSNVNCYGICSDYVGVF
tara:strand:+ start:3325 stop:3780 length:456 start_codon:yes stop_codon:yes gene_type:complete